MAGQGDFLNDNERKLIKHAPLLERVRAISEVVKLREALENMQGLADTIREIDPETAHVLGNAALQARHHIEELMAGAVPAADQPEAVVAAPIETPAPIELPVEAEVVKAPRPEAPRLPVRVPESEVQQEPVELGENALSQRARHFLGKITDDSLDSLTVDDLDQTLDIVVRARTPATKTRHAKLDYKQVLLDYLTGVSVSEIAALQHSTVGSVNKMISKVPHDVIQRSGGKIELLKLIEGLEGQPLTVPEIPTQPIEAVVTPIQPVVEAPVEAEPAEIENLSGEPRHIQLAAALSQKLELDGPQRAGLASLLDPKSRGDMTINKEQVLDRIKKYVRTSSGLDDEKFKLTAEERQWLYKLTGITSFYEPGKDVRGASVSDIVRPLRDEAQRARVPVAVYNSLDKVFGLVEKKSEPAKAERTGTEG